MSTSNRSTRARRRPPIRNIKPSSVTGIDPTLEYRYIREDLTRILLIGFGLIVLMIILAVLNIF
ncbi:MAG: hypothetical protein KAX40_03975 [Herpetosiphon sp.]|nr:hypothetical protein [Herpetosiphon sp.]